MRVFVAGEGPDEIGDWAKDPAYLPPTPYGGVVEALLRKVRDGGWHIGSGCPWRRVRKFKAGRNLHDCEERNVLGAIDQAAEAGCDAIAFVRDRDGDVDRERAVEAGLERARELNVISGIIGGVAIETIDAWILALLGESRSEVVRNPKRRLEEQHNVSDGMRKVEIVAVTELNRMPSDASSLERWILRARFVLGAAKGQP